MEDWFFYGFHMEYKCQGSSRRFFTVQVCEEEERQGSVKPTEGGRTRLPMRITVIDEDHRNS